MAVLDKALGDENCSYVARLRLLTCVLLLKMSALRGFKVTDADRKIRIGIAARSLDDLKKKTIEKWNLKLTKNQFNFQLPDGTAVATEEYFNILEPQTLLVWVQTGKYAETDAEILYKTIREVNDDFLSAGEKVQEFFTEKMKNKVYKLATILKNIENTKAAHSKREDHPEWFDGLDTRSKTKEEYMYRRSQDRIRTYYYKTKDELKRQDLPNEELHELLIELKIKLKRVDHYGCYFDRTKHYGDNEEKCLCDPTGVFICQGRWDKESCLYNPRHNINPYSSREERIMFQTWNFDHKVERTRTIIPAIAKALKEWDKRKSIKSKDEYRMVYNKIFRQLFTTDNLKLVHIVCHDKRSHRISSEINPCYY